MCDEVIAVEPAAHKVLAPELDGLDAFRFDVAVHRAAQRHRADVAERAMGALKDKDPFGTASLSAQLLLGWVRRG